MNSFRKHVRKRHAEDLHDSEPPFEDPEVNDNMQGEEMPMNVHDQPQSCSSPESSDIDDFDEQVEPCD